LNAANLYYAQPLLALLSGSFQVSIVVAGSLVTISQIGYAAGMLLLVPLGDRIENRKLVSILLTVTVLALLVAGTSGNFPVLLGISLVIGMTSSVAQILVPLAANLAPEASRGKIVGQVMSGLLTGILLSRTFGSFVAEATSWRVVYLGSAILLAILLFALRAGLPQRAPDTNVPYRQLLRSTLNMLRVHAPLRRRTVYQATMFGAFSAFWTTISFVLTAAPFHYSQLQVGIFALIGAGGAFIAPQAGRWADRGLTRPVTAVAFTVVIASFALAVVGRHHVVALAAAGLFLDMAVQVCLIMGQHTIYALEPQSRARLNSAFVATFFLGGAVGSQVGTIAFRHGGWVALCVFGAALPLLSLLWWTTERSKEPMLVS
jgi:predicted MFS family arabinose efflux permease